MFAQDWIYIGSMFFVNFVIGLISWPLSRIFFHRLSDKGYSISHILGWFGISYLWFLLSTLKIIPLYLWGGLIVLAIWLLVNILIQYKFRVIDFKTIDWRQIASIQIGFLALVSILYFIRGHNPEIYQIERFMDYGFIRSLFNQDYLPLYNFWFHAENLNYYYFGHFVGYNVLTFSFIPPLPGFFILLFWIWGLVGINVFRISHDLYHNFVAHRKLQPRISDLGAKFSGILGVFFVLFAGTFHVLPWLYKLFMHNITNSFSFFVKYANLFPEPTYWYADATRDMPGVISEMPIYGFLVADLHPHIWAILIGVFAVTLTYVIWISKESGLRANNLQVYLACFILGIAYMTNSWDVLTLGSVLVSGLIIKSIKGFTKRWWELLIILFLLPLLAYAIALPWSYYFSPPVFGVGFVNIASPFINWFGFWGPFIILIGIFFGIFWKEIYLSFRKLKFDSIYIFPTVFIIITAFFLLMVELVFMKDLLKDGDWYRANTVFKIANQIWVWLGIILASVVGYLFIGYTRKSLKIVGIILASLIILVQGAYSVKTINQSFVNKGAKFMGITAGDNWFKTRFSGDYNAYKFLEKIQNRLPRNDRVRNILEAEGDSFDDYNFYSTYLGWPTVLGWYGHIWTWYGTNDVIEPYKQDVRDMYISTDVELTQNLLDKYQINYIIIGETERRRYAEGLQTDKLRGLGKVIYDKGDVVIVEV